MTFQESIRTCFTKYAEFTGRASRPEYWWFVLFIMLVSLATSYVSPTLSAVWSLGTLLPAIAVATRRLHDTNRSGWWQLIALVPLVGTIILIVFLAQEGKADVASLSLLRDRMLTARCHCGAVTIGIPRAPETLTNCSCSICRRYGTLWAYFDRGEVTIDIVPGATTTYAWGVKSLRFVRCATCGCVTHWERLVGRDTRMGINARLFDPEQLGDVRIRWLDGAGTEQYLT